MLKASNYITKLFAVYDYHLAKTYNRYSRHIYDLHMVWNSGLLNMDIISNIFDDVVCSRQQFLDRNLSSKPGTMLKNILKDIILKEVYKKDYNDVTLKLIYNEVSYEDSIQTLTEIISSNIIPEVI